MKRSAGVAFLFLLPFAACSRESGDGSHETTGGGGGRSGSTSTAGESGSASGGAPAAGASGAPSTAGKSGASSTGGTSGTSGQPGTPGGAAGRAPVAGASGTPQGGAGGASGSGATASGGSSGSGATGGGLGGAPAEAGAAGENAGGAASEPVGLSWPIDCIPGQTCLHLGYPDIDGDGDAHDCGEPGYFGHQGTDIDITEAAQAAGTAVRAAADGVVLFAFDGKYDQCPNATEPDCQAPPGGEPGSTEGHTVCTPIGPYCGTGEEGCFWCFAGGNVVVIRHSGIPGVFATRYDHLKKGSVLVQPGDSVARGETIGEAASSGSSTGPHLHFEVWGTGFYELADPWAGPCGPNTGPSLWAYDPPWSG